MEEPDQVSPQVTEETSPNKLSVETNSKQETPEEFESPDALEEEKFREDASPTLNDQQDSFNSEKESDLQASVDQKVPTEELENQIIQYCEENGCLWEDDEFPAGLISLYNDPEKIPDYDKNGGCEQWLRPNELAENPVVFLNDVSPGDVEQGALGDCWFLGSLCVVSTHVDLIHRLFVNTEHVLQYGFVTCQFFKNGEWQQVIVDTRIPYNSGYGGPIYGHCKDTNEMWIPLLEKAYAKLHGGYEILHGGKMTEALVDLTGEASEKYNLKDPDTASLVDSGEFWTMLIKYHKQGNLLGCANAVKNSDGEQHQEMASEGIWNNHAYGILDVREIKGLKLVRIRNPWGEGEWKGAFADEDEEWDKHRGLKDELNYEFGRDGTWWMTYEDWLKHYNKLYVGRVFSEKWQKYSIDGKWGGKTAGGPAPSQIDRDEETSQNIKLDSDDKWFNNPQYRITVYKKTQVFISLMQEDQKLSGKPYMPCNFLVVKTNDKRNRIWEKDKDEVIAEAADGLQRFGQREITRDIVLEPSEGKKQVNYVIIPNLELEGKKLEAETSKKNKGRAFWLRIFTSQPIDLWELSETLEIQKKGEWNEKTAGGRKAVKGRDNPIWCTNPQYFLQIYKTTLLKIIVRKTGRLRQARGHNVGMVVCQAPQKPGSKKIAQTNTKKNLNSLQEIPKYEKERKLQILSNEWYVESYYQFEDYSCLFLELEPNHGPFLVVPSLSQENIQANYSLTIFSNYEVTLEKLEDSQNVVISGEWNNETAGGSHLYEKPFVTQIEKSTWASNPKYLLKFESQGYIRAKVTLSRPEKLWSSKIARNTVGCMMGLYVFDELLTRPIKSKLLRDPTFMPINEITEVIEDESPSESGYTLMPATYENGIKGPFILSVSSDDKFTISKVEEET